ncbi:MAG: HsdR family type I site-specific deoxyribonuclease [Candidatus Poribacteria bacterium]|jgi:type I restriction enzyme R subunit|nr:HsdR family type I site-specific deoxyribonuclease [Candidatus Poribacteria bacterium]MDP6996469.1 HsdR family type I site-specific deoxyribonuclease [Candidatus Poribacteria bacterium]
MTFNEANTVEAFVCDLLCGDVVVQRQVREAEAPYGTPSQLWQYLSHEDLPRQNQDVLVVEHLRQALIRLNPSISVQPDRVDDVLYRLREIIISVRSHGLVKANEEFAAWMTGEKSMPFGSDGEHITIKLIDFDDLEQNQYVVTQQFTFKVGSEERRADLVLLINGIPLVVIETKTPVRPSQSWLDGALQIHEDYEENIPELFVPNVFSMATEGKDYRYGSVRMPVELWGPWRVDNQETQPSLARVKQAVESMLKPEVILDLLSNFTTYATQKGQQRIKIIARYQQYEGANKLVDRVVAGQPKTGLIWHFQGSGKSLLMLFAANKLRLHPQLNNPTVIIVVDRIDLDTQITGTFNAADAPNLVKANSRKQLKQLLDQDVRKIIITTIYKFGVDDSENPPEEPINERSNIIILADEAHRTQEGDLGIYMRRALPNAFRFGLTGTPINRRDRNTFTTFGSQEDENGYMSRYGFEDSIRDGATKELHFEPRLLDFHLDQQSIDAGFQTLTSGLDDSQRNKLARAATRMSIFLKASDRVCKVCTDIAKHFQENVAPNGFGAQIVTYDREGCDLYKKELDRHLPSETSEVVMSVNAREKQYTAYHRDPDAEEKLLDRFRDAKDPLKILIVTSKLLTGFDAPILQTMYLDKPLRDHTLLQAICRTNRPYGQEKTHGLIVDYLGVFDDVAQSLYFDEEGVQQVVRNIAELKEKLPAAINECLSYFDGVDRTLEGYAGLMAAQECLPDTETRDHFADDCSVLGRLWEAISPDPILIQYTADYRWLMQVYESVKLIDETGRLLWRRLGAKTVELIHQSISVDDVQDDLETLILDNELLEVILNNPNPDEKAKEIEFKITRRLRKLVDQEKFRALSERLEELKNRHRQGLIVSIEFLKELLNLAREIVEMEQQVGAEDSPVESEEQGKAALTELFEDVKNPDTPIIVENLVNDVDQIVRVVRFDGWQKTHAGEREIKKVLRRTLFKYKLHQEQELFQKAYQYIEQHY